MPPTTSELSESSGIMRTSAGLRRKVLVRELGLRPFAGPASGERAG